MNLEGMRATQTIRRQRFRAPPAAVADMLISLAEYQPARDWPRDCRALADHVADAGPFAIIMFTEATAGFAAWRDSRVGRIGGRTKLSRLAVRCRGVYSETGTYGRTDSVLPGARKTEQCGRKQLEKVCVHFACLRVNSPGSGCRPRVQE